MSNESRKEEMPSFKFNSGGAEAAHLKGRMAPYASEEELLDFANRLRACGGANALEALIPSVPRHPEQCLIANALNFSCDVRPLSRKAHPNGVGIQWVMVLPQNMDEDRAKQIADQMELPLIRYTLRKHMYECLTVTERWALELPLKIGNTAQAFDERKGWTAKYLLEPKYSLEPNED